MPTKDQMVKFKAGLESGFLELQQSDSVDLNTVYFLTDKQRMFVGETEYTRPIQYGDELPSEYLPANSLFVLEGTGTRDLFFSKDGASWEPIAHINDAVLNPEDKTVGVIAAKAYGSATKIPVITVDSKGAITAITEKDIALPSSDITVNGNEAEGNVITGISATGRVVTVTKGTMATKEAFDTLTQTVGNKADKSDVDSQISAVDEKADQGISDAASALSAANSKVASVSATDASVVVDNSTATAPKIKVGISGTQGNSLTLEPGKGLFVPTAPAATVTAVAAGEKVLSLSDTQLSTTMSLKYNSGTKKIQLLGISDAVVAELDATAFIKDGMVESASYEDGTITLTFNTDAGKEAIEIDVSSLVDTYTAGNGINILENVVSAKIDNASESFLTVSPAGIKLSGVQSAITSGDNAVKAEVIGSNADLSSAVTVYGARKLAQEAAQTAAWDSVSGKPTNVTGDGITVNLETKTVAVSAIDGAKISGTVANANNAVNATSATSATQDAAGNVITETYATKEALEDATLVWGEF